MARILLIDDEPNIVNVLSALLQAEGHEVNALTNSAEARDKLRAESFDLLISDVRMTPVSGMELLKIASAERPELVTLMLTAYATVEMAIEAMKLGAFDYVTKPFKVAEFLLTVQRALDYKAALSENRDLKAQLETRYRFENIVAESASMHQVCEMIERVAPTDTTILICGDSGTGKELVAKAIHSYSGRKDNKFLAVNCAALPEALLESEMFGHVKGAFTGAATSKKGLFESVEGGTIFLDEVGSMPLSIQGKLLRVLQEKEIRRVGGNENIAVDARVLAATNSPLEDLMEQKLFREDLYYRLSVIPIKLEPLRERPEDIMPLVYHVIRQERGRDTEAPAIDTEARAILETYAWPGNVRELANAIKHALTFATENRISRDLLPANIVSASAGSPTAGNTQLQAEDYRYKSLREFLRVRESEYLERVIDAVDGDKERAADALKISLATLYRKLQRPDEAEAAG